MRALRALLIAAVAFAPLTLGVASASCAGPTMSVPDPMRIDASVTVTGSGFYTRCNDTPGPCQRAGLSGSYRLLELELRQGGRSASLASVTPDGPDFEAGITLPARADGGGRFEPGRARIVALDERGDEVSSVQIRLRAPSP